MFLLSYMDSGFVYFIFLGKDSFVAIAALLAVPETK